jgi:hypothetical protein
MWVQRGILGGALNPQVRRVPRHEIEARVREIAQMLAIEAVLRNGFSLPVPAPAAHALSGSSGEAIVGVRPEAIVLHPQRILGGCAPAWSSWSRWDR